MLYEVYLRIRLRADWEALGDMAPRGRVGPSIDRQLEKIGLWGIDCPEQQHNFGTRTKQLTSTLVFSKVMEIDPVTKDRYGRTVAFVNVEDSLLHEELIRQGLAWVFTRY